MTRPLVATIVRFVLTRPLTQLLALARFQAIRVESYCKLKAARVWSSVRSSFCRVLHIQDCCAKFMGQP